MIPKKKKKPDTTTGLPFAKDKCLGKAIDENIQQHSGTEADLQKQCEEYLKVQKIQYVHIPNSLFKVAPQFRKMFGGLPDLIIFKKGIKFDYVLFVELKRDTGEMHQNQRTFARHFNVYIKRSLDDFINTVNEFFEG